MKIAFCTCVQIGLSCIESIIKSGGKFDLLLTLYDEKSKNKSGRVYLDEVAKKSNTPLFKLNHINDIEVQEVLRKYEIDWLFIIGWSQIASLDLINTPKRGVIGAHPTLLPEGRGRAAVPWAILKGLTKTGVTFFKMDEGVDTGPILDQYEIALSENENATELYQKVNEAHIKLINQIWPKIIEDNIYAKVQDEKLATYWEGRTPKDGELFFEMNIEEVDRLVRATTKPYPGAYLKQSDGKLLIIWKGSFKNINNSIELKFSNGSYFAVEFEYLDNLK